MSWASRNLLPVTSLPLVCTAGDFCKGEPAAHCWDIAMKWWRMYKQHKSKVVDVCKVINVKMALRCPAGSPARLEALCGNQTIPARVRNAGVKAVCYLPHLAARILGLGMCYLFVVLLWVKLGFCLTDLCDASRIHCERLALYIGFSRPIFRMTWTIFFCNVSKTGRRRTFFFFTPAYAARNILK